jgi:hypothetical protein
MRVLLALGASALVGCASPVTLDRYRGAFTTHFDGEPDRAQVCAIVTNHGDGAIDWIRLRLRSWSTLAPEPVRWTSLWVYRARLEPGESAALALVDPPVAEEIELDLRGAGTGVSAPRGRLAAAAPACSDESLQAALGKGESGRTAEGRELHASARRGHPDDALVAEGAAATR